eukprot:9997167-Karenia_brevis.AAC.1
MARKEPLYERKSGQRGRQSSKEAKPGQKASRGRGAASQQEQKGERRSSKPAAQQQQPETTLGATPTCQHIKSKK